eukprot:TRINITY_DN15905_c0_g1_i1.p1 TRINITY_DN15905_c0_g1~~TRINITY_DN15905_c0_g1_i1.p1  ORF type:complete len:386 (+),score=67.68 TRINITY_DN15905_c0_g1_i1:65-1222(+)
MESKRVQASTKRTEDHLEQDEAKNAQRSIKRKHIVKELYTSEKSYVSDLDVVVQKFILPLKAMLKESHKKPILNMGEILEIFSNFEHIWSFHCKFLNDLGKKILNYEEETTLIGPTIMEAASKMHLYHYYIDNLDKGRSKIASEIEKKSTFSNFLRETELPSSRTLDSYLILPVQRIPRYILLVQDIISNTSPTHPDRNCLQLSLVTLKNVADLLNNKRKFEEQQEKMENLCSCIRNFPKHILVTNVKVLFRGVLWGRRNNNPPIKLFVILFDKFLVLSTFLDETNFQFIACLSLPHFDVIAESQPQCTLSLKPLDDGYHIFASDGRDLLEGLGLCHSLKDNLKLWWAALHRAIRTELENYGSHVDSESKVEEEKNLFDSFQDRH